MMDLAFKWNKHLEELRLIFFGNCLFDDELFIFKKKFFSSETVFEIFVKRL